MIITNTGYYLSDKIPFEDWHAGHHMKYEVFGAKLFQAYSRVLVASAKIKVETKMYKFKIENSKLRIYRPDGSIYQEFSIINNHTIVDEYGITYKYIPFVNEEE